MAKRVASINRDTKPIEHKIAKNSCIIFISGDCFDNWSICAIMNKFSLCFLSGPLTGTSFPLEKPEIILGSSDNCDISLQSEMISSSYMSLYVGAKKVTILIDSSGFLPILNNELVLQPTEVNSGDVLFLPDGSIGYFQSGSKELSVAIDIQQNTVSINGGQNQMLFAIPNFRRNIFAGMVLINYTKKITRLPRNTLLKHRNMIHIMLRFTEDCFLQIFI